MDRGDKHDVDRRSWKRPFAAKRPSVVWLVARPSGHKRLEAPRGLLLNPGFAWIADFRPELVLVCNVQNWGGAVSRISHHLLHK
jgi:hypothetical protein